MRFCYNCGAAVENDTQSYCSYCGGKVEPDNAVSQNNVQAVKAPEPIYQAAYTHCLGCGASLESGSHTFCPYCGLKYGESKGATTVQKQRSSSASKAFGIFCLILGIPSLLLFAVVTIRLAVSGSIAAAIFSLFITILTGLLSFTGFKNIFTKKAPVQTFQTNNTQQ